METNSWVIALVLFILMLLVFKIGILFGKSPGKKKERLTADDSMLNAGIFTLMAFLLAFTFTMAGTRFDSRKKIIIDESNAIGTAILRLNLYPDSVRSLFIPDFKEYLEARILFLESKTDLEKIKQSISATGNYGNKIFKRATELSFDSKHLVASLQIIPALNEMLDIANTRFHDELYKVPEPIIFMLFGLLIVSSFIYGYSISASGKRVDWILFISFCLITVMIIYFMLDLDRSRRGLINLESTNAAIIELRELLKH